MGMLPTSEEVRHLVRHLSRADVGEMVMGIADIFEWGVWAPRRGMLSLEETRRVIFDMGDTELRDTAVALLANAVRAARGGSVGLDSSRALNGWIATAEETVAAGDGLEEILSRRWRAS